MMPSDKSLVQFFLTRKILTKMVLIIYLTQLQKVDPEGPDRLHEKLLRNLRLAHIYRRRRSATKKMDRHGCVCGEESTSTGIAPTLPHQYTSMATAT